MSRKTQTGPPGQRTSPMLIVLVSGAVLLAVGVLVLKGAGILGSQEVSAEELTRVLIVAASQDDAGSVVGQIIVVVDVTEQPATIEPLSPAAEVTIPGTSYDALGDAYPFGGGRGTAEVLGRARDESPLPYVAVGPTDLAAAVEAAGGVSVAVPVPMSVFDGDGLFAFKAGTQLLSVEEFQALLKGAPYLTEAQREKLDSALAASLVTVLANSPEALAASESDLSAEALARLESALGEVAR